MIKCENSTISINGTKEDVGAEFGVIYNALYNFFDKEELDGIINATKKYRKIKEMED
jgi:hypothetical protein